MLLILIKIGLMKMKNDKFKYYLFYRTYENSEPELYGYTDDKEVAKHFKKERDKNKFVCKVHECTHKDIKMLHDEYPGSEILICSDFSSKKRGHGSGMVDVSIAMITDEYHTIISNFDSLVNFGFASYAIYPPVLFNKDIKRALKYIDYFEWNKLYEAGETDVGTDYTVDVVETFIYFYGKLLGGEE